METIHFTTKISKTGTIRVPLNLSLENKEVEVILIHRGKSISERRKGRLFLDKWSGFMQSSALNDPKFEYLMTKHK